MKKSIYDFLRIAQIIIPALGTLYTALASVWGWQYGEAVVATCAAVTAFIGVILKTESKAFFSENIIIPKEIPEDEI